MDKAPCVYIMANQPRGTLYVGVTSDLVKRVYEHKYNIRDGFTTSNSVKTLVWFERHATMPAAIRREKSLKRWSRIWKFQLIETGNPDWKDLFDAL